VGEWLTGERLLDALVRKAQDLSSIADAQVPFIYQSPGCVASSASCGLLGGLGFGALPARSVEPSPQRHWDADVFNDVHVVRIQLKQKRGGLALVRRLCPALQFCQRQQPQRPARLAETLRTPQPL